MHLKNFSLIKTDNISYTLSPNYDLISSALVVLEDKEDFALTLNAKKKKIKKRDFIIFAETFKIDSKVIDNIFNKFSRLITKWFEFIDQFFIPEQIKQDYKNLIIERSARIELLS